MPKTSYWQRFQRQRMSRRRMLATVGTTSAGIAVVAACGGGGDGGNGDGTPSGDASPTPGSEGTPIRGGTMRQSVTADWGTIDPVTSVASGPALFPRIYNVLLERSRRQPEFFYQDLAETLEQPDDVTYIFNIRPGVKIAPNDLGIEERDLDSSDAEAWMTRLQSDPNAVAAAFVNDFIASFEAPDPATFNVNTGEPYAYFLFRVGPALGGCIPPKEFFEQEISLEQQGVGAGPWVLRPGSFSESGAAIVDRNVNYYRTDEATGEQLPYIDSIEWTQILDRQPRRTAFIDKQIHTYAAENADEMEELRSQIPDAVVTDEPVDTYIAFNMKPDVEPFTDDAVRKAASAAMIRQEYVDRIVGPEGGNINGIVHWPLGAFALDPDELAELQPEGAELSRQILQDAGYDLPVQINVMYPVSDIEFHDQHLPIFLQHMEAGGFQVNEEALDFGTWLARYQNLEYDSSLALNQIYETPEIDLDWHSSNGPQGDQNFGIGIGTLYPEIDEAIRATKGVTNPAEQIEAIKNVQRQIYERGPSFLPIMSWVSYTLRHALLKNVTDGLGGAGLYLTPEWYIDPTA